MSIPPQPSISLYSLRASFSGCCLVTCLIFLVGSAGVRADLVLTNYTAATPLKIMPVGDSITDDCGLNGAWRLYLQPLLQTNGYAFTNVGRWLSSPTTTFTKTRHEGICGAVIAFPGMFGYHTYPTLSNYALRTVTDALTNYSPDLFVIDLGVNDMGYGRNPWFVATNDMAALLDLMFAKVPSAHIIVGKPTSITRASIGSPLYSTYGTNMPIYCAALQTLVNARRALGQNVGMADFFSAVSPLTMLLGDGTHPNPAGYNAMAKEVYFRISSMTARSDQVVTPFIGAGSVWKYSDQGLDLGTNWSQPAYDDSGWSEGAGRLGYNAPGIITTIGYGGATTNRYITTYFRRSFVVPTNNVRYTTLHIRLNRGDGAVVWLNGRELFRMNLPAGPLTFQTRAIAPVTGDPLATYYPTNVSISSLPAGTNVLAVELHKNSPVLGFLSFDLELFGMQDSPALKAWLNGSDVHVRWPATNHAGFILVSGTDFAQAANWAPLGGPYVLNGGFFEYAEPVRAAQPANFYRLLYTGLPDTPPVLAWLPGSNFLSFSWPTDYAGFNLELSTNLPPGGLWQTVPGPYLLSNACFGVSLTGSLSMPQFFRLRKPVL